MKREIEYLRKRIEDQSSMFKGQINKSGAVRNRRGAAEMEEVSKRKTRRLSAAGSRERSWGSWRSLAKSYLFSADGNWLLFWFLGTQMTAVWP